jgi:hypothetical protein
MRARERDALFDIVKIAIGRAVNSIRSSPRKRGPMITGRCSCVPALAALGRHDDRKNQPARVAGSGSLFADCYLQ